MPRAWCGGHSAIEGQLRTFHFFRLPSLFAFPQVTAPVAATSPSAPLVHTFRRIAQGRQAGLIDVSHPPLSDF